jgi:hypothetical protein
MFLQFRAAKIVLMLLLMAILLPSMASAGAVTETTHKYLGYSTIILAGATAATNGDEELHETLAYVTAFSALSTVLTGYIEHSDRFDTSEGLFSKENIHIMSGVVGTALLVTAVAISDDGKESSHSSFGIAGGLLMTFAVVDIKW